MTFLTSLKFQPLKFQGSSAQSQPQGPAGASNRTIQSPIDSRAMGPAQDQWVRFGSSEPTEPPKSDDTAVKAKLENIVPHLKNATDWKFDYIRDQYGESPIGSNLSCRIGDTRYTMREVWETRNLPSGLENGNFLIAEGTDGTTTDDMDYEQTFGPFWQQFIKAGAPALAAPLVDNITQNVDQFKLGGVYHSPNDSGHMGFKIAGRPYSLQWDHKKEEKQRPYMLYQAPRFTEAELRQFYTARKKIIEERNATLPPERRIELESFEEYKAKREQSSSYMVEFRLTRAQFEAVFKALNPKMGSKLAELYHIGEGNNPRPLLKHIAQDLLANPRNGHVGYRLHDSHDEVTYETYRGEGRARTDTDQYIEFCKYPKQDKDRNPTEGYDYSFTVREGGPGVRLFITDPDDIALYEKMLEIVKKLDTSYGGNWHLALEEAFNRIQDGHSTVDEEVGKVMPKIDNTLPDLDEKPADDLQAAAGLLDQLQEMLGKL